MGGSQTAPATPGSDVDVNMQGYISLTPMRPDLTCHASLAGLRGALEKG